MHDAAEITISTVSTSLGAVGYRRILTREGVTFDHERENEGGNR